MHEARAHRLTPDELIAALAAVGVRTSRTTLARWVRQGLVPEPLRGSGGRAIGRYSLYPPEAVGEAAASAYLLRQGVAPQDVAAVRRLATSEYVLDPVLDHLGLGRPASIPWVHLEAAWLTSAMGGDMPPALPPELERLAGPPMRFRYGESTELLLHLWLRIRDLVNAGEPIPKHIAVTDWLRLHRTERGTYRFAAEG